MGFEQRLRLFRFDLSFNADVPGLPGECEPGNIRTRNEAHAQFGAMLFVNVVGCQSFAQLRGRCAHNMIEVCVVQRVSAEDFDPDGTFLDLIRGPVQGHFHHIPEESDGPLAGAENLIANQQFKLRADHLRGQFRRSSVLRLSLDHRTSSDSDFSTIIQELGAFQ